ncbi:hypothetical protein RIF29_33496 [Crotalaria pallida]|uniref:F-box domain-containing protein n=1 Tax=Crotalaria pallida TaxID=3830 RepID=A0AAN9E914_CROPI
MDDEKAVDWSSLPLELWSKIGKYLDNRIEILRFRSVCKSWRSSLPNSPSSSSSSSPLTIPHPFIPNYINPCFLNLTTIYLLQPTHPSSPSSSNGFLIKVSESENPPSYLLSPISGRRVLWMIRDRYHHPVHPQILRRRDLGALSPPPVSVVWNLLDYRVFEVSKSYSIRSGFSSDVSKVVFFHNSGWRHVEEEEDSSVACCVFKEGRLGLMKHGDEKWSWSLLDDKNFYCDDVIVFKGQFYVTDKWGTISWFDISSYKLVQYSPPLCGFGNKKHLVESCGSLYVVDRYYVSEPSTTKWRYVNGVNTRVAPVECFKVYKLDEELGTWVNVNDLGDRVFILGNNCNFSISAKDVRGYQGNCIYFNDLFDSIYVRMYNLQDASIITIELDPTRKKVAEEIRGSVPED